MILILVVLKTLIFCVSPLRQEAEESLPGDVDKISPKGMRTRSRKGAKKDEQEDAPVSRPRTQKKREVGRIPAEEKAIKRDKNTPKRKKSSARN